jgi:hypothetical protein
VIGSASDIVGVWIEPVIAQLMMILFAIGSFLPVGFYRLRRKTVLRGATFVKYAPPFKRKNLPAETFDDQAVRLRSLASWIADQIA